jgi:integrase
MPALPIPQPWSAAIERYERFLRSRSQTAATIRARREQLRHLARRIGASPADVTADMLLDYVGVHEWAQETRRSRYACFRAFWAWAKRSGLARRNVAKRLPSVEASQANPDPVPEPIYEAAMRKADERTTLIMRMAHDAGLRRSEIAQGHSDDLRPDLIGWSLLVHGKGRKQRIVPLTPRLALELRALGPGYFFPGQIDGHLSPRRVYELVDDVLEGHWTLHNLRHSFATNTHEESGGDTLTTQGLLGHASPATTARYVRVSSERAREVVYRAAGYEPPKRAERILRAI